MAQKVKVSEIISCIGDSCHVTPIESTKFLQINHHLLHELSWALPSHCCRLCLAYQDFVLALKLIFLPYLSFNGVVFALAPISSMFWHKFLPLPLPLPLPSRLIFLPYLQWCCFCPCPHFLHVLPSMFALALALSVAILCHGNIEGKGKGKH